MLRRLLLVMLCGLFMASCGGGAVAVPTAVLPSPTTVPSSTAEPIEIAAEPIAEIQLESQTGTAYTLDWSPDGKILAADSAVEITMLSDDLQQTFVVLKPEGGALCFAWSPDQAHFASVLGFRNQTITIWDWDSTNKQVAKAQELRGGSDQYGVSWSPDGELLASLGNDRQGVYQIWSTGTWEEIQKYELPYANPRRALNWSADSSTLYDAGEANGDAVIFALNVKDGTVQELAKFPVEQVAAFTISPDTRKFAIAGEGVIRILDAASGNLLAEFPSVPEPVDLAWNPNGMTLAVLDYKTTLQLWDVTP